ncbi:MAG: FHA domain-containing protein [Hahellaceae bacterium]|nr:FHA domain-containing protein [Hahellaceae bacterium]
MLKLQFKDRRQKAIWLVNESFTIGSASTNSLVLSEKGVASAHAEITNQDNSVSIRASDNQAILKVNNERVVGNTPLKAGDTIQIASIEFEIIDPKSEQKTVSLGLSSNNATTEWQLQATASWMADKVFPIKNTVTIGRDPSCDISIKVEHLSRKHAEVEVKGGKLFVKDLGSSNGTYVNGKPVKEAMLNAGDKLKLDVVTFDVVGPEADPNKTIIRMNNAGQSNTASPKPKVQPAKAEIQNKAAQAKPNTTASTSSATRPQNKTTSKPPIALFVGIGFVLTLAIVAAVFVM